MALNDDEIWTLAQKVAHIHTAACRNRPAVYANQGHGRACEGLARDIALAMVAARDGKSATPTEAP